MADNAAIIAVLNERKARILSCHERGLGKSSREIVQTLGAIDHPASYYAALTPEERDRIREEWHTLAVSLKVPLPRVKVGGSTSNALLSEPQQARPRFELPDEVAHLSELAEFMVQRLPNRPYCSNDKTARNIRATGDALKYAYIQPNPPGMAIWLVFDVDRPDAVQRCDRSEVPIPNIIVANPQNGHAHYFYCLQEPVCLTFRGRRGPQRYLRAVYDALGALHGSDPCYTGLIAKNPLHPAHLTIWLRSSPYTLGELAERLDLESGRAWRAARRVKRGRVNANGRNCSLFDDLREWAYDWVGEFRESGDEAVWHDACLQRAHALNSFPGHLYGDLPESEVRTIVRSVANWTWSQYGGRKGGGEDFLSRQAERGAQKGARRRAELMGKALEMHANGVSNKGIARELGITPPTVANWLKRGG